VYRTGGTLSRQLTWFDRKGTKGEPVGEPNSYIGVALAPDGVRGMATRVDSRPTLISGCSTLCEGTGSDLRLDDSVCFLRSGQATAAVPCSCRMSKAPSISTRRVSAPRGPAGCYSDQARTNSQRASRVNREAVLFHTTPSSDLWLLPLSDGTAKPVPLLKTQFNELDGQFSPDHRWIAYQSDESGRPEISVRAFQPEAPETFSSAPGVLVSRNGGIHPRWRADGRELFYQSTDGRLTAVAVAAGAQGMAFQAVSPVPLFAFPPNAATVTGTSVTVWSPRRMGSAFSCCSRRQTRRRHRSP